MSPILKGFLYSRFEKVMKKITATGMKVLQTRGSKILKVWKLSSQEAEKKVCNWVDP